jgi:hypothetical protein
MAYGSPTIIYDTTPGIATEDGTVGAGEYPGFSGGINNGFGDIVGQNSQLHVDSDADTLIWGLITGGGSLFDRAVIYIDCRSGGFANTTLFNDNADGLRAAISAIGQINPAGRADITFAPGFEADFAIGLESGYAGLWELVGGGSHNFISGEAPKNVTANHWEFNFGLADLGLGAGDSFRYVVTYGNPFDAAGMYRSDEFHGVAQTTVPPGNIGVAPVTLADCDWNTFHIYTPRADEIPTLSQWGLIVLGLLLLAAGSLVLLRKQRSVEA